MIDGTQGFRSKWMGLTRNTDGIDFGLFRYPELMPSQFGNIAKVHVVRLNDISGLKIYCSLISM